MDKAFRDLARGFGLYKVWLHQSYHTLSAKYKRTILGTLWIAGNFVFTSLAVTLVFGALFNQDMRILLPYAMLGNLAGTMCLWLLGEAPEMYLNSSSIIKNHAYPFTYFSFESVSRVVMLFGHNLIIFYIFMIFNGTLVAPTFAIIPGLLIDIAIMLVWGQLIGMLAARFRDLRFLLPNLSIMLFFLTPIYWRVEQLGDKIWIAELNPLHNMVSIIRQPLLGQAATTGNWLWTLGILTAGIIMWLIFFSIYRRRIPFWV